MSQPEAKINFCCINLTGYITFSVAKLHQFNVYDAKEQEQALVP